MNIATLHRLFLASTDICTDSRKITNGCMFFALKGDNFNGNKFAQEALDKGAAYAIVDEAKYVTSDKILAFHSVLKTLQALATYHRHYCNAKVIALTGSNGKTTTKELIYAVLSQKYNTVATKGNLNNHIGVPLTLLSIKEDTEIAIVEMGANHQKEIEFLCSLAQPDFGYITNFGKAHLEGFGGVDGVIKGKSELYTYLIANNKPIFLNADDVIQREKLKNYINKFGYSDQDHEYYIIKLLGTDPHVALKAENSTIKSQLVGAYNFTNCCAALLMGKYFNVPLPAIKEAIENYIPENNRSQIIKKNGRYIILDAYNANPTSMEAALENFKTIKAKNKVVFLGDMFELGDDAPKEHQHIADLVLEMKFDDAYLIGENFAQTHSPLKKFESYATSAVHLKKNSPEDGYILIKGSRGMALERILDLL
ncbi:MAG: UDP-N-acetylmuramoyl-tripeptide--D-alanyl-D-alanine ligase [Bacteroidota bacterium]